MDSDTFGDPFLVTVPSLIEHFISKSKSGPLTGVFAWRALRYTMADLPVTADPTPSSKDNNPPLSTQPPSLPTPTWEAKENAFLLEQLYQRSFKRYKEHRADPIDLLSINTFREKLIVSLGHLSGLDKQYWNMVTYEALDPVKLLDGCKDKPALIRNIQDFLDLEPDKSVRAYWRTVRDYAKLGV